MSDLSIQRLLAAANEPTARHTLHPGDVKVGGRGDQLETLLGSCVSVVLTDPRRTVGVMSHIVHPGRAPGGGRRRDTSYADGAFEKMFELLLARGIHPGLCEAYVYGGGNMFPDLVRDRHVGHSNAAWVLDALHAEGIVVLLHDLGGNTYRRLSWTVGTDVPQVTAVPV